MSKQMVTMMRGIQTRKMIGTSRRTRTHAVECEGDTPIRVLCGKVQLSSLATSGQSGDIMADPTCPRCLRRAEVYLAKEV